MPPGSTRPQRPARCQSSSVSRTSRRGCEVIARCTSRSAARAQARESSACEICGQGLTALGERLVEQGEARRHERVPGRVALEQVVGARRERLQHVAVADDLGGGAVADADVDAERAVDHEHAGPVAHLGEAAREVAVAGRRREHDGGHDLPGHEPHAQVELGGRGRRRDRAGSGTTTSAARRCSRARAARATLVLCPCVRRPAGRSGLPARRGVILHPRTSRRGGGNHDYTPLAGTGCNHDYAGSSLADALIERLQQLQQPLSAAHVTPSGKGRCVCAWRFPAR